MEQWKRIAGRRRRAETVMHLDLSPDLAHNARPGISGEGRATLRIVAQACPEPVEGMAHQRPMQPAPDLLRNPMILEFAQPGEECYN